MKSILKISELSHWIGSANIPACTVDNICEVENYIFSTCLGEDLYCEMMDSLIGYADGDTYSNEQPYNDGDIVIYCGVLYEANKDTENAPSHQDWGYAPKFDNDCFNDLWCNGLARFISLHVLETHLISTAIQFDGNGLHRQRINGQSNKIPADYKEIEMYAKSINNQLAMSWLKVESEILNKKDCFSNYLAFKRPCDTCRRQTCRCDESQSCTTEYQSHNDYEFF